MSKLLPEKYFTDCEPLVPSKLSNTSRIKYEKIKLEFSIQNAKPGSYSLQGKLYDKQVLDFFSEMLQLNTKQQINCSKFLTCDFYFEKEQDIQIIIFKNKKPIPIKTTLGKIIASKNCIYTKKYFQDEILEIKAEKLAKNEKLVDIKFNLKHNSIINFFEKNQMYFLITSANNKKIYKSAEIKSDGTFDPIHIPVSLLQPVYTVKFFTLQKKLLFTFNRSIENLQCNEKYEGKVNLSYNNFITLKDDSEITKNYTFIDYIKSGVKIALSIGIDFTASNGDPLDYNFKTVLHPLKGSSPYEKAIRSCGNIVGLYDYDQLFPVFGFGAIINNSYSNEPSMCFNLNFENNPDIYTIDNVIKVYKDCIQNNKLTFSGPTKFSPLLRTVKARIKKEDLLEYHILMILTDGNIDDEDKQDTIDELVEASLLPLSVIIIGIGKEDFSKMDELDGDIVPLTSSKGIKRMRDLVQFVPFSEYENDLEKLTMEVLAEIPRQMSEYYQFKNLNPKQISILAKTNQGNNNNGNNNGNNNNGNTNNPNANANINIISRNQNFIINQPNQNQNGLLYDNVRNQFGSLTLDNTRNNPYPQKINNAPPPPPSTLNEIKHINNINNIPKTSRNYNNNRNINNNGFNTSRNNYNINSSRMNQFNNTSNQINNSYHSNNNKNKVNKSFQDNNSYYPKRNFNNNNNMPNQFNINNNNRNNQQSYNNNLNDGNNFNLNLGGNTNVIINNYNMINNSQNGFNYPPLNFNQIDLNNLPIFETIKLNQK